MDRILMVFLRNTLCNSIHGNVKSLSVQKRWVLWVDGVAAYSLPNSTTSVSTHVESFLNFLPLWTYS